MNFDLHKDSLVKARLYHHWLLKQVQTSVDISAYNKPPCSSHKVSDKPTQPTNVLNKCPPPLSSLSRG